jgi:hypothetical protein
MNVQYLIAGGLALLGAAVHGMGGHVLIVRRLRTDTLPSTPFGGPGATRVMVWVTWHVVTLTFAIMGASLLSCAGSAPGAHCSGLGRLVAVLFAAFAVLSIGYGLARGRQLLARHLGPWVFVAVAVLAWVGSGSG